MENQEHRSYVGAGFLVIHMAALEQGRVFYDILVWFLNRTQLILYLSIIDPGDIKSEQQQPGLLYDT